MEKQEFIKVGYDGSFYIVRKTEQSMIDIFLDIDPSCVHTVEIVEMTEEQYKNLAEFEGF